jgi:prevent-host-death family protein
MEAIITANELKTKGVEAIRKALRHAAEAVITLRGKGKFVVLPIDQYDRFRERELDAAVSETLEDVAKGRCVTESAAKHLKRISRG